MTLREYILSDKVFAGDDISWAILNDCLKWAGDIEQSLKNIYNLFNDMTTFMEGQIECFLNQCLLSEAYYKIYQMVKPNLPYEEMFYLAVRETFLEYESMGYKFRELIYRDKIYPYIMDITKNLMLATNGTDLEVAYKADKWPDVHNEGLYYAPSKDSFVRIVAQDPYYGDGYFTVIEEG